MKILLSDCLHRKSFDVFNILKRHFNKSDIILVDNESSTVKGNLIYGKKIIALRKDFKGFNKDLRFISQKFQEELIVFLPVEEDTIELFYNFINENGTLNFRYCLPAQTAFQISKDKLSLNKFCLDHSIPAPSIFNLSDLKTMNEENFIPLIVKPRIGMGSVGIIHLNNLAELILYINKLDDSKYVIQEKIRNGRSVIGGFFLSINGKIISSYCHERIRTYPIEGGVTVLSKSIFNDKVIELGSTLLQKLEWTGFAMIEFLWDEKDSTYKVIEVNPRLWGSILLSEFTQSQFISSYVNLCLDSPLISSSEHYNKKIRWLPFDFINLLHKRGKIEGFWNLDIKNTCYVNMTYGKWTQVLMFHFFFYLNIQNFIKIFIKWKR